MRDKDKSGLIVGLGRSGQAPVRLTQAGKVTVTIARVGHIFREAVPGLLEAQVEVHF